MWPVERRFPYLLCLMQLQYFSIFPTLVTIVAEARLRVGAAPTQVDHSLHSMLHSLHSMLHSLHSMLHSLHSMLHSLHSISTQHAPFSTQHTPFSTQHAPFSTQHTPFSTQHAPFSSTSQPHTPCRGSNTSSSSLCAWSYSDSLSINPMPGVGGSTCPQPHHFLHSRVCMYTVII